MGDDSDVKVSSQFGNAGSVIVDRLKNILVGVDFSLCSVAALTQAVRIAALDGSRLHILHVHDDPWHGLGLPDNIRTHMPDFSERYHRAVESHLRSFCEPISHEIGALKAEFHAMQFDGHGRGIVDFVMRQQCDLVVLGTPAKWNLRDFLLGSTAERVVREAPCSVLAIKPPDFEQPTHSES